MRAAASRRGAAGSRRGPGEELVVVRREAEDGVLQEREGRHIGEPEVAEEVVAILEQRLEDLDVGAHLRREGVGGAVVGDLVRCALPDPVEPVCEDPHLGAARGVAREQRRVGKTRLEPLEDRRRVGNHFVVVRHEDRDEPLPAHGLHR